MSRQKAAREPTLSAPSILCWLVLAVGTMSLCQAETTAPGKSSLARYIEIWNSGEIDRLDEIVAPDFTRHAGPDESCSSLDELKTIIVRTRVNWKRLEITVDDSVVEDDKGAYRGEFWGVHGQTNRIIQFPIMSMIRFRDGLISEEWIIGDNFLSLMVLGHELVPPGFEIVPPTQDAPPDESPDDRPEEER